MVVRDSLAKALLDQRRSVIERETLPQYIAKRRWFGLKDQPIKSRAYRSSHQYRRCEPTKFCSPRSRSRATAATTLLAAAAGDSLGGRAVCGAAQSAGAGARAARPARRPADRRLCAAGLRPSLRCLPGRRASEFEHADGVVRFQRDRIRPRTARQQVPEAEVNWLAAEQSNSSLTVGDAVMLKIYRRISPGEHPEAEMGRYLTAQGFTHAPPLLGDVVALPPTAPPSRSAWRWASSATKAMPGRGSWTSSAARSTATHRPSPRRDRGGRPAGRLRGHCRRDRPAASARCTPMLARETSDPAFAPQIADASDAAEWATERRGADCQRRSMPSPHAQTWRARSGPRTRAALC